MTHHITRNPTAVSVAGLGRRHIARCTCGESWRRERSDDLDEDLRKHREATA